jgi:hypothetical protein
MKNVLFEQRKIYSKNNQCILVKCILLHIDNHQHGLVIPATIIIVYQRIQIKYTLNC